MSSCRGGEGALEYEIARQKDLVAHGERVLQETRLWDADRGVTRAMRSKESAHDYRYFPEPDLLPLEVSEAWIEEIRESLPKLPDERRSQFMSKYGMAGFDADELTARKDLADYFEKAVDAYPENPRAIRNWVMGDLMRVIHERKLDAALVIRDSDWPVSPKHLARLVSLIDAGTISGKIAKTVFERMLASGSGPQEIVDAQGLTQVSDVGAIEAAIATVLDANSDKVAEYRGGKDKLFGFFVGQVMKATQGKANPQRVNELLKQRLAD
jgi:aspartyl-tRNA(Asn)/glutamyl-tRNA(Gln) amidotransferase subunit B